MTLSKRYRIITYSACIGFSLFFLAFLLNKCNKDRTFVSPDTLYLTAPVVTFSGVIERTEDQAILISNRVFPVSPVIPSGISPLEVNQCILKHAPKPRKITYRAIITPDTEINRPPLALYYLFKAPPAPPSQKLSIKDLKIGDAVTALSKSDLRLLRKMEFTAISVYMQPIQNTLNAKITDIKDSLLVVRPIANANDKEYTIIVTEDTEISRAFPSRISPYAKVGLDKEKFDLSDLSKDMQVIIYSDVDVNSHHTLTALRIEPIINAPALISAPQIRDKS